MRYLASARSRLRRAISRTPSLRHATASVRGTPMSRVTSVCLNLEYMLSRVCKCLNPNLFQMDFPGRMPFACVAEQNAAKKWKSAHSQSIVLAWSNISYDKTPYFSRDTVLCIKNVLVLWNGIKACDFSTAGIFLSCVRFARAGRKRPRSVSY